MCWHLKVKIFFSKNICDFTSFVFSFDKQTFLHQNIEFSHSHYSKILFVSFLCKYSIFFVYHIKWARNVSFSAQAQVNRHLYNLVKTACLLCFMVIVLLTPSSEQLQFSVEVSAVEQKKKCVKNKHTDKENA